jgi:hypothetical protein
MTKTPQQIEREALELKREFGELWRTQIQPVSEELKRAGIAPSALCYECAWKAFRAGKERR